MTAPFKMVACIPTRQLSPTVQPCTTALCPTDTPRPSVTSKPGPVCSTALSCTLVFSPTVMRPVSARSTAPYHTLLPGCSTTSPASVALGATNVACCAFGDFPFTVNSAILQHLCLYYTRRNKKLQDARRVCYNSSYKEWKYLWLLK